MEWDSVGGHEGVAGVRVEIGFAPPGLVQLARNLVPVLVPVVVHIFQLHGVNLPALPVKIGGVAVRGVSAVVVIEGDGRAVDFRVVFEGAAQQPLQGWRIARVVVLLFELPRHDLDHSGRGAQRRFDAMG